MFLKKPCGVFLSFVLAFSLCLLLCVDSAWAVTNTDMAVYVAPYGSDPLYFSSRINVPSSGGSFWNSDGAEVPPGHFTMVSNVFSPTIYARQLFIAIGVTGLATTITSDVSLPVPLQYRVSGSGSWQTLDQGVFANLTSISSGSKSNFVLFRIVIPANTVEFRISSLGYAFGNDTSLGIQGNMATLVSYGSWLVDANGNNADVFERIYRDLLDLNSTTEDIYSIMSAVSDKLDSIDSTVTSIYDLLNSAISEAGQELSDTAAQQAQNVAIVEASESDWYNMNDNAINTVGLGNTTLSSGILSGVSVVSSIFVRIWQAVPEVSGTIAFILLFSLALVILGRISRSASSGGSVPHDRWTNTGDS